ncbi:MAG: carboxypeptidase-like regulatory domain-containing protein [Planctomycetota bacterium]
MTTRVLRPLQSALLLVAVAAVCLSLGGMPSHASDAPPRQIVVRVDAGGKSLDGVRVVLWDATIPFSSVRPDLSWDVLAEKGVDRDGTATFKEPTRSYLVTAVRGSAVASSFQMPTKPESPEPVIDLAPETVATIKGRLNNLSTVRDVSLRIAGSQQYRRDEQYGYWPIGHAVHLIDGSFKVLVEAPASVTMWSAVVTGPEMPTFLDVEPGVTENVTVEMPVGKSLRGRVLDKEGKAIAAALITVVGQEGQPVEATSDPGGEWSVSHLQGTAWGVIAHHESLVTAATTCVLASDMPEVLELRLVSGEWIEGRLTWDDGQPIANTFMHFSDERVFLTGHPYARDDTSVEADIIKRVYHLGRIYTVSNKSGFFRFGPVVPGTRVRAYSKGQEIGAGLEAGRHHVLTAKRE